MGEVLDHHEHPRPGIVDLVGQFARGVERVDVDGGEAAEQHAEKRRRIGQDVRHHQRDAVTLLQPLGLQPAGEGLGRLAGLDEGDRLAEALEGRATGIGRAGKADQVRQRTDLGLVEFRRNGRRIMR